MQALHPSALQQQGALLSQLQGAQVQLSTPYFLRNVIKGQVPLVQTSLMCPLNGCAIPSVAICPYVYQACNGSVVAANGNQRCAPVCPVSDSTAGAGQVTTTSSPPPPPKGSLQAARPLLLAAVAVAAFLAFLMASLL